MVHQVTEVEIIPVRGRSGFLGIANVVIDDALFLGCLSIYSRPDGSGVRVAYPTRIVGQGKSVSVYHPIRRDLGALIEAAVNKQMQELFAKLMQDEATRDKGRDGNQQPIIEHQIS